MLIIKKNGIWIALICTLAACIWVAIQEETAAQNIADQITLIQPKNKRLVLSHASENQTLEAVQPFAIQRISIDDNMQNIFTTFADEGALAQQNVVAEIDLPPVNPFVYAGKIVDEGNVMVFLTEGSNNYLVKAGDFIDDAWQVLSIAPPIMTIKYIPRRIKMQMQIGAVS